MSDNVSLRSGMVWTAIQKFGNMGISFISNIVLARLLMPSEYGTIGILMVFIAFSEIFVDGGFASALIQKKDVVEEDYNSVFTFNISISSILYIFLYLSAPLVGAFFNDDNLIPTLRVIGIVLLTNSLSLIQITHIQKNLGFKQLSYYNLIAVVIGTSIAIVMAISGHGVWSLVAKTLMTSVALCTIVWLKSTWLPQFSFSFSRVKQLFNFGGFILLSTFIEFAYAYAQPVLIGKFFSMRDLGLFSQARKLEEIPVNSLLAIETSVLFPVFSKLNDNMELLVMKAKRALNLISYISFPMMIWLMIYSKEIILLLLGEKWVDAASFLSILCIAGIFKIPSGTNMCIIKSIGKSKAFMIIQLIKRIIGIMCIVIGLNWNLLGLMWGFSISSALFFVVDSMACGKYLKYGVLRQLKEMIPSILISGFVGFTLFLTDKFLLTEQNTYLHLMWGSLLFGCLYLAISKIANIAAFNYYETLLIKKFRHAKY